MMTIDERQQSKDAHTQQDNQSLLPDGCCKNCDRACSTHFLSENGTEEDMCVASSRTNVSRSSSINSNNFSCCCDGKENPAIDLSSSSDREFQSAHISSLHLPTRPPTHPNPVSTQWQHQIQNQQHQHQYQQQFVNTPRTSKPVKQGQRGRNYQQQRKDVPKLFPDPILQAGKQCPQDQAQPQHLHQPQLQSQHRYYRDHHQQQQLPLQSQCHLSHISCSSNLMLTLNQHCHGALPCPRSPAVASPLTETEDTLLSHSPSSASLSPLPSPSPYSSSFPSASLSPSLCISPTSSSSPLLPPSFPAYYSYISPPQSPLLLFHPLTTNTQRDSPPTPSLLSHTSAPILTLASAKYQRTRLRQKSVPNFPVVSIVPPRHTFSRSSSLSSLPFCGSPCSPNRGESTTSTTLSCAYSQPFLSVPSTPISRARLSSSSSSSTTTTATTASAAAAPTSTASLLRNLDAHSLQAALDSDMSRRRSLSTSSIGALAKSPSSLTASLSASVALYDTHQPPKTLQDILLLAQSHYISHRYVPALTLYRLAAERHHSLPACCSLYALYTSTVNAQGLIRSDTKATEVLIYALRIWTARRWSSSRIMETGSRRSKTRDDHSELEEYFVNSGIRSKSHRRSVRSPGSSISINKRSNRSEIVTVAASVESEYRQPRFMSNQGRIDQSKDNDKGSSSSSKESDECSNQEGESDEDYEDCEDCSDYEESDEEDEEHAKEEEARRIGLATMEIDDIVQKLCLMIQKSELGLNEPVLVEAISMLRKIERGLKQEEEAWKVEQARSMSLQGSTLAGEMRDESMSTQSTNLLLTKGIDLSFLDLTSEDGFPIAPTQPLRHQSGKERSRHHSFPYQSTQHSIVPTTIRNSPVNPAILKMSTKENEADQAMCRSLRIRIMFTLGWVHMKKGEYYYGAQAYGVCSDIMPTRKRTLDSLQQQATVQKWTCIAFEKKKSEQEQKRIQRETELELKKDLNQATERKPAVLSRSKSTGILESSHQASSSRPSPVKNVSVSCASSIYTTSDASTATHNPDISSPSSLSSSESAAVSIRGHVGTISSLSAAMWNSGLFRPSSMSSTESSAPAISSTQSESTPKPAKKLQRSKSANLGLKINTLETRVAPEVKDPHHHHNHHHNHHHHHQPHAQHRPKSQQAKQQQEQQQLTMVGHQKKVVKCGHCDEKRILMPLCVCKKVRYCNRECRLADLEAHRQTGCHAALMGLGGTSGLVVAHVNSAVSSGIAI